MANMSHELINECCNIIVPSITKLVNYSLIQRYVPDGFKTL